jgi:hypothetical protein
MSAGLMNSAYSVSIRGYTKTQLHTVSGQLQSLQHVSRPKMSRNAHRILFRRCCVMCNVANIDLALLHAEDCGVNDDVVDTHGEWRGHGGRVAIESDTARMKLSCLDKPLPVGCHVRARIVASFRSDTTPVTRACDLMWPKSCSMNWSHSRQIWV